MTITYAVWRVQFDPKPEGETMVERFGQKFIDGNPIGGPMDLRLVSRPLSSFGDVAALSAIDPESDIASDA